MPKTNKRKHLKISNTVSKILLLFFLLSFGTVKNLNAAWQGSGTEADPWQITSRQCLEALADSVNNSISPYPNWSNGKYFSLMNDITDTVRTVIGVMNKGCYFMGHFDGGGFTIVLGIEAQLQWAFGVGLFGTIHNATISNVKTEGFIRTNTHMVGVVGFADNYCIIENVINNSDNSGDTYVGGVVGWLVNGKILNSQNTGNITATGKEAGGIAACVGSGGSSVILKNNLNSGKISAYSFVGGILGHIFDLDKNINTLIIGNLNLGIVEGNFFVGGILSFSEHRNSEISNNSNYGFVRGVNNIGGILGAISNGTVSNNFSSGVVEGASNVGCIIGLKGTGTNIIIENNHYDTQMCGEEEE